MTLFGLQNKSKKRINNIDAAEPEISGFFFNIFLVLPSSQNLTAILPKMQLNHPYLLEAIDQIPLETETTFSHIVPLYCL